MAKLIKGHPQEETWTSSLCSLTFVCLKYKGNTLPTNRSLSLTTKASPLGNQLTIDVSSLFSISINFRGKGLECPRLPPDGIEEEEGLGVLWGVVVDMLEDLFRPLPLRSRALVSYSFAEAMELGDPNEANAGEEIISNVSTPPPLLAPGDSPTL
jgi:hypothetical protein